MNNKPEETNSFEEDVEESTAGQEVEEDQSDAELDDLFSDEEGLEDVEGKGDTNLSLEELSNTFGRKFKSKEDALKHAQNLKSFAGDQKAIKERKAQKELEAQKQKEADALTRVQTLEKEIAKKDFLISEPTAKDFIDVVELYANSNEMTLDEAWASDKFKSIAEASQRVSKQPITNNRITPARSQKIDKLKKDVLERGNDSAKEELVKEWFKQK